MENNKVEGEVEDKNSESCKKHSCCGGKHHKCFGALLAIIIFICVFAMGLAIGHRFGGERGERGDGYGRFDGGCGMNRDYRGNRGYGGCDGLCGGGFIGGPQPVELQGFMPGRNLEIKGSAGAQGASTSSTVTK